MEACWRWELVTLEGLTEAQERAAPLMSEHSAPGSLGRAGSGENTTNNRHVHHTPSPAVLLPLLDVCSASLQTLKTCIYLYMCIDKPHTGCGGMLDVQAVAYSVSCSASCFTVIRMLLKSSERSLIHSSLFTAAF